VGVVSCASGAAPALSCAPITSDRTIIVAKNVVRRNFFLIACSSSIIMKYLLRVDRRSKTAEPVVLQFGKWKIVME
jgi:hypothetical protein